MCFFLFGLFAPGTLALRAQAETAPPYNADFESPTYTAGSVDGQNGWSVQQGTAEVDDGVSHSGDRSLKLTAADLFSQAKLTLDAGAIPAAVMFLDFWLRPVASAESTKEEMLDVDGARIGLFRSDSAANQAILWLFDGDRSGGGEWIQS
jgi:hypothetical protein